MIAMYTDQHLQTVKDLETTLQALERIDLKTNLSTKDRAIWIKKCLQKYRYRCLKRSEKKVLKKYLKQITGLKERTIKYHITAYKKGYDIGNNYKRNRFNSRYTKQDIELLAEVDDLHGRLNGISTKIICKSMYESGDSQYKNLSEISVSHLYNLRKTHRYKTNTITVGKTVPVKNSIGERKKPLPNGKPGYIRVDTVHQGDKDGQKGVYHINLVDEVTQWDIMVAVEKISEYHLINAIEGAINLFPFRIINFHSDNGSEFINKRVEQLLNKLLITQTKSRPRISNDNGLVESKNASIIRKQMGHWHISQKFAPEINKFYEDHLIPYVNYHRPAAFPVKTQLKNGKIKITYPPDKYQTPLQKLLSLEAYETYLKTGISKDSLLKSASAKNVNQAAKDLKFHRNKLLNFVISKL